MVGSTLARKLQFVFKMGFGGSTTCWVQPWALVLVCGIACGSVACEKPDDGALAERVAGNPAPTEPAPEPKAAPSTAAWGLITSPSLGQNFPQTLDNGPVSIAVRGVHTSPGVQLSLVGHGDEAEEVPLGETRSAEVASQNGMFPFAFQVQVQGGIWVSGGIFRIEARADDASPIYGLVEPLDQCAHTSAFEGGEDAPRDALAACSWRLTKGLILVQPSEALSDDPDLRSGFLLDKGVGSPEETALYYETIDAPPSAEAFRERYGIGPDTTDVLTNYNFADLATGRGVQCVPTDEGGAACFTANFDQFSGELEDGLEQALEGGPTGGGAFAYVTMVYTPPIDAPNAVKFMVYGPDGSLINEAALDGFGDNPSIPQNCINCHGSNAEYDPETHEVTAARFLPFDRYAFAWSEAPGFRLEDQAEALRQANATIYEAGSLSDTSSKALDAQFGGRLLEAGGTPGSTPPAGWNRNALERAVYKDVIAHCRACHQSRPSADPLSFSTGDQFKSLAPLIVQSVCEDHTMPSAQAVMRNFWARGHADDQGRSMARAYMLEYLGSTAPCSPPEP